MSYALTIGVPYDLYWHLNPRKLKPFEKAYKNKQEIADRQAYTQAMYFMSALDATVCNAFLWRRKGEKAHEFLKEPFSVSNSVEAQEAKMQKQRELFAAQLVAMQANFEMNKKNKDDTVS